MDAFTRRHLDAFLENVWDDERDDFDTWVTAQLAEDPELADLGWQSLLNSWRKGY